MSCSTWNEEQVRSPEIALPLSKICTSGVNHEFIHIGESRYLRSELVEAIGGTLSNQLHHTPTRTFANSTVAGLCSFSLTTFCLALFNLKAQGLTIPNLIVGPAWFYGGMIQIILGLWEIVHENTFACTTFISYGAYFLTYGALFTPAFGVQQAYTNSPDQFEKALGLYMICWFIFSVMITVVTIRSSWPMFIMFICISMSYLLNGCGYLSEEPSLNFGGAGFSFGVAILGWYMAFEGLAKKETCYFQVKPLLMPGAQHAG